MSLLTIGAFARASRLSPKALRLYDELGLLPPAEVDPASGYRFYDPAQLDRARLVAWLRRLGMPLTRIRLVCDADEATAAREVRAFWDQVLAETAARQDLAAFLVDFLSGKATAMSGTQMNYGLRFAARSDRGLVRSRDEDCAYAGPRVLAVADGLGGKGGGDRASAIAVRAVRSLEDAGSIDDPLAALGQAVRSAAGELRALSEAEPLLEGLGTTLTALLWSGSQVALAHLGDSRAYLLRDEGMFQLTVDHTYVQSLVREGQVSAEEAQTHPQRHLLVRALDASTDPEPDLSLHAAQAGDRYLLCTDGLSCVVPAARIQAAAGEAAGPDQLADALIGLANAAGGPDNVACVIADVVAV
ncbi:MAG TPA: MerR family transcriptional regulator [Streptosporangiaceae bacterium]